MIDASHYFGLNSEMDKIQLTHCPLNKLHENRIKQAYVHYNAYIQELWMSECIICNMLHPFNPVNAIRVQ